MFRNVSLEYCGSSRNAIQVYLVFLALLIYIECVVQESLNPAHEGKKNGFHKLKLKWKFYGIYNSRIDIHRIAKEASASYFETVFILVLCKVKRIPQVWGDKATTNYINTDGRKKKQNKKR